MGDCCGHEEERITGSLEVGRVCCGERTVHVRDFRLCAQQDIKICQKSLGVIMSECCASLTV
jgi:hypothetical protein